MKSQNDQHRKADHEQINSRRRNVVALAALPVLLLGLGPRTSVADAAACFELEALPASQKRLRRSLGFRLADKDDQKHCGSCAFFTASSGECGTCEMLSGGVVATGYVCESWAAKG